MYLRFHEARTAINRYVHSCELTTVVLHGLLVALLLSLLVPACFGQNPPAPGAGDEMGIQPYLSLHGGDIDHVNLTTGGLSLNTGFLSYPQRGKLHVSFSLLYNTFKQHFTLSCVKSVCTKSWTPTGTEMLPVDQSSVSVAWAQQVAVGAKDTLVTTGSGSSTSYQYWGYWSLYDADGSSHLLGNLGSFSWYKFSSNTQFQIGNGPWRSLDATGWLSNGALNISTGVGPATPTSVVDPDGIIYSGFASVYGSPSTNLTDPNGNLITGNATTVTDSLGRQIPLPPTASSSQRTSTSSCPVVNGLSASYAVPWTPPTYSGGQAQYTFCYVAIAGTILGSNWNALQSIVLPNGQNWQFEYDDTDGTMQYGTLTNVTLPTGGTISYTYTTAGGSITCQNGGRWVSTRTENANDGTGAHKWAYTYNTGNTVVTDPLGNDTVHTFTNLGSCAPYETETQYYEGSYTSGTLLETVNTTYSYSTGNSSPNTWTFGATNVVPTSITTVWPSGKTSKVTNSYDTGFTYNGTNLTTASGICGQKISSAVYDYSGSVLKTTKTTYASQSPNPNYAAYLGNNLLHLPYSVQVLDGGGTQRAYAYYGYDESGLQSSGISEQKTTGESHPGNQTSVHRWLNGSTTATTNCAAVTSGYLVTNNIYFDTGLVQRSTDPCTYVTTFLYDPAYYGAYPTTITNALGQSMVYGYDFNTGSVTSIKDPNLQTTSKSYDSINRLIGVSYPDGGSTTYCYTDGAPTNCPSGDAGSAPYAVVVTKAITSSTNKISTATLDGVGRLSQTQLNSDPSGTTYTLTAYDALGRKYQVYNPTRCASITTNCQNETTWGATAYSYDPLDRLTSSVEQDGSIAKTTYDQTNPNSTGLCGTATDEVGNARQSCVDGLGRVTGAWEDPGSSPHLNYETDYSYDALGNLTNVNQKGSNSANARARGFVYDSLSELTSVTNPESGTITYAYDADGNVITKTAPLPNQTGTGTVTTTYSYDKLNRLTQKTYLDGTTQDPYTSTVQYGYDGVALSNCTTPPPGGITDYEPIGRRTSMCEGSGGTSWTHDKMGRVLYERRTIGAATGRYDDESYNLDGSPASVYALSYTIAYTYNGAGQLTEVNNTSDPFVYANNAAYAPTGELTSLSLGATPITLTNAYNDHLQPILLSATNSQTSATLFSECFDFHLEVAITGPAPCAFAKSTLGDNGNVYQVVNNRDSTRTQSFSYDALNRITTGQSSGSQWGEAFTIDAWGNLTNRTGISGKTYYEGLSTSAGTNNQLTSFGYDAAGNMTSNSPTSYVYDAENRLVWTSGYRYIYDGDGKRVETCAVAGATTACPTSGTSGTLYWYGMNSDPQAETDLSGNVLNIYLFFNGQRIARRSSPATAVHFYFSDHLGTHSVVENAAGTACEQDIDYYPYGGQENDYCSTPVTQRYKFTGKERDSESGLDDFPARYYTSSMGRWMTPDPMGGHVEDPQTLNRYAYARNNPVSITDPTGLDFYLSCQHTDSNGSTCQQMQVGTDKNGNAQMAWVQGVTGDNGFTATQIGNDANGNLVDRTTGTGAYTADVTGSGVQLSNNGGATSATGVFLNKDVDLSGTNQVQSYDTVVRAGNMPGFLFTFQNSKMEANQTAAGFFTFDGTMHDAGEVLNNAGFHYMGPIGLNWNHAEYRSWEDSSGRSGHFNLEWSKTNPLFNVPTAGDMHFGEHNPLQSPAAHLRELQQ